MKIYKNIYIFFIYYRVDYVASKITLISGFMTRGRHHRFLNSYVTSHKNVQKKNMIKTMNIHVPIFPANRIFRYVADVHLIAITFSYKSKKK